MGSNGSWKTHILDAIHLLSGSRPLYGDISLDSWTQFEGIFSSFDFSKNHRLVRDADREYFLIQGSKHTRPKYMQALPWRTVHISPFDMNLLYFAPSMRRDYIDLILSRTHEQFSQVRKNYDLAMKQRNALLKKIREWLAHREDLDFWDGKFAEYATIYGLYRTRYRDYVQDSLVRFPAFFWKYNLLFSYESSVYLAWLEQWDQTQDDTTIIVDYLKKNRERDILTWHTHIGPHRDDWWFVLNSDSWVPIPVESYLSRWEMKMLLLGLKLIEADYIKKILDLPVILLIDDIFAELDQVNSDIFLNSFMQHQIILTSQKSLPNHEKSHDFICINLSNL
jgi:DNA replication and repair protein RecF